MEGLRNAGKRCRNAFKQLFTSCFKPSSTLGDSRASLSHDIFPIARNDRRYNNRRRSYLPTSTSATNNFLTSTRRTTSLTLPTDDNEELLNSYVYTTGNPFDDEDVRNVNTKWTTEMFATKSMREGTTTSRIERWEREAPVIAAGGTSTFLSGMA